MLKISMQGYDVEQLQKDLAYLNYNPGNIDGIFGPRTLNAVKRFQAQNGLAVDGIVGKQTAYAIINRVSQPVQVAVTPSRGSFNSQELEYLARVVFSEARGEPYEGMVAVASVVLNRLYSGQFGNTVRDIIFQPGAFTAVSDGQFYLKPNAIAYKAVQAALNGWDPSNGALYYWNPAKSTSKWIWSRSIIKTIGQHVFGV